MKWCSLQVFSLVVDLLPLTEDLGEYETVCQCLVDCMFTHYKPMVGRMLCYSLCFIHIDQELLSGGNSCNTLGQSVLCPASNFLLNVT